MAFNGSVFRNAVGTLFEYTGVNTWNKKHEATVQSIARENDSTSQPNDGVETILPISQKSSSFIIDKSTGESTYWIKNSSAAWVNIPLTSKPFYSNLFGAADFSNNGFMEKTSFSADNRTADWTMSFWFRTIQASQPNFCMLAIQGPSTSQKELFEIVSGNSFQYHTDPHSAAKGNLISAVIPFQWNHVFLRKRPSSNTIQIYINGTLTRDSASGATVDFYNSNHRFSFGKYLEASNTNYKGYMSEIHFIDGQYLDISLFGEDINGEWYPKKYEGSHGTNGFHLIPCFYDQYVFNPTNIGFDYSGSGNNFSPNSNLNGFIMDSPLRGALV